jgi:NTP pyrophosphatase (non-canonical NTP hydrolase)
METLALVMGEEYGELCRAIHDLNYQGGTRRAVVNELRDTAAVCIQMAEALEAESSVGEALEP